jgi:hypothetical protein
MFEPNPCSKKDDTLLYEKRYKIIVGSATDTSDCLLYRKYRGNNITFTIEHPNIYACLVHQSLVPIFIVSQDALLVVPRMEV